MPHALLRGQDSQAQAQSSVQGAEISVAHENVALRIGAAGQQSIRISLLPANDATAASQLRESPDLALKNPHAAATTITSLDGSKTLQIGDYEVTARNHPLRISVARKNGELIQQLRIDEDTGAITFPLGEGPLFGLGAGGPQYDRRGKDFPMVNGEDAYDKPHFGGVLPIAWLLGDHWALFFHQPEGAIDLTGTEGKLTPRAAGLLPFDIFVVGFREPIEALTEYARITGFPSMPPVWALGYQQSHRTVSSWQMVLEIARTFREKRLPCDVLIYLGTGWAPSGWNTGHRSFTFNPVVFPDPAGNLQELHDLHFKVILHEMGPPKNLTGSVKDPVNPSDPDSVASYWALHAPVEKLGVDGWWPDEGENLSPASRLARIRMYWEGPQLERPDVRPYTLNRTGFAGMQRMGGWLWSGDTTSSWQTLAEQVPVGINTSLSGVPYWGTDIGGFFSTKQLTGELFARWFEFAAFTPLFRSHGRPSATRYPWSWNTGQMGEPELSPNVKDSALPNIEELHNPAIEPICRKYLELRYRLMPYLYSLAHEANTTGLPILRALWLYYNRAPQASSRGDEYLWGRDFLVAPVTEQGAASRTLYLPQGVWYDFWTHKRIDGGREITRPVDLATLPLYARAGAIIPTGPLKQYTTEKVEGPLTLTIYPGADGRFILYDDDGVSFAFEHGQYTEVALAWNDRARRLTITPTHSLRVWNELARTIEIQLVTGGSARHITLGDKPQTVQF